MSDSKKISQKEIIVQMILEVCKNRYHADLQVSLSASEKHRLQEQIVIEFQNGSIPCRKDKSRRGELYYYAGSLISEWLRKDRRLNGGEKYKPISISEGRRRNLNRIYSDPLSTKGIRISESQLTSIKPISASGRNVSTGKLHKTGSTLLHKWEPL